MSPPRACAARAGYASRGGGAGKGGGPDKVRWRGGGGCRCALGAATDVGMPWGDVLGGVSTDEDMS